MKGLDFGMETRTITEAKVYYLVMNGIFQRAEEYSIIKASFEKQTLIDFYRAERCEPYKREYNGIFYTLFFKEGGPLQFYNPVHMIDYGQCDQLDIYGQGIHEEWIEINRAQELVNTNWL